MNPCHFLFNVFCVQIYFYFMYYTKKKSKNRLKVSPTGILSFFIHALFVVLPKKGYGTKTDSEYCLFGKPDKAMG